jgi:hypothetical protein
LSQAIRMDTKQPDSWQREILMHVQSVISLLSEASRRKISDG